ncbi:hypothetical protein PsYK624_010240 [Phanerochaete sordida]|uniref:F-box domain-containing protein n=1 Tax=Phanerochaete sordida TaxID=48140 RepID=A0A9P3FXH2_9APHY|nr:hypothetical protein PsYK624_010240 [Phanerochaete sordida]
MGSSAVAAHHRRGLNDLPNELLYQIIQYLDAGHHPQLVFNVFNTLQRVCRRLQRTVEEYWHRRHLFFRSYPKLLRQMRESEPDSGSTSSPRRPKVKELTAPWFTDSVRWARSVSSNIHQLPIRPQKITLETPPGMSALASRVPQLEQLGIFWQSDHTVPPVDLFPALQSLKIIVDSEALRRERWEPTDFACGIRSVVITTLAVHELTDTSSVLHSLCDGSKYAFPNLRVLHLTQVKVAVPKVYDFVHRHPTLLEVSVGFAPWYHRSLRLEALVKLIQGTGQWVRPKDQLGPMLDQPSFEEYVVGAATPPDFDCSWGAFYEFAFARVPVSEAATSDLMTPRYLCTALAIRFLDRDRDYENLTAQLPTEAVTFLDPEEIPEYLRAEMQELRLSFTLEQDTCCTFDEVMRDTHSSVRSHMQAWPKLQKLALYWPFIDAYWQCPHVFEHREAESVYICRRCDLAQIPFLDWLVPRFFYKIDRHMTLAELTRRCGVDLGLKRLEDGIRSALCLDADAPLDRDDPHLLFWAWEAHNYTRVAKAVRSIAAARPTLQEFDWHIAQEAGLLLGVVVWKWRIQRRADGSIRSIDGQLWWTGGPRGDPPPFLALVGQEREKAIRDARGCWSYAQP